MAENPAVPARKPAPPPYRGKVYPLTPEQIQQILRDANRVGWETPGEIVEETTLKTDPLGGDTSEVPTGKYTLTVRGPDQTNQKIILRQGEPTIPGGIPGKAQESWVVEEAPETLPKPVTTPRGPDTLADKWGGQYQYDATKPEGQRWTPIFEGDQAAYQAGKTTAAKSAAEYAEMQRNEDAGRGFMSTGDWHTLQLAYDKNQITREELTQRTQQASETNRIAQQAENRLGTTAAAQNQYTGAQTTNLGVETQINEEKLRQLIAAGPAAERAAVLANEVSQAQLDTYKQKLKQPGSFDLGAQATYGVTTPEGTIEERYRQGYVPKTYGEIAARRGQIQQLGLSKRDELMAKVKADPSYTEEQAFADFNTWYDRNVAPQIGTLQAAEEEAQIARGKEQATARQAAFTAAQAAGNLAVSSYNASSGEPLDPEFGKLLRGVQAGKVPTDVDYSKMWAGSGLNNKVQQATAEALKYIDPTAAQMTGTTPAAYTNLNPAEVLDRTKLFYGDNGPQTVATGPPPGPPATGQLPLATGAPDWQRADQAQGVAPPGNAQQAPGSPPAGWVPPGSPQYLGNAPAPSYTAPAPYDWSAQANVTSDLQELMRKMRENNVYQYGAA